MPTAALSPHWLRIRSPSEVIRPGHTKISGLKG